MHIFANRVTYIDAYYLKMKPWTLLKFSVCFPISLHIVGQKWVMEILKERGGVADYNLLYVLY